MVDFPNEIILNIVGTLSRSDLKCVRFLSKTWSSCATPFLFDKVYVSSSKEDLEVFEAVTQHPTLSQYIRRLVYDGTEFLPKISKKQYVSEVYGQLRRIIEKEEDSPPNSTDPDVNKLFEEVVLKKLPLDKTLRKFRACRLIRDGHKEYKEHAVYQQESLRSGNFFESLARGLQKLDFLTIVTLEGGWPPFYRDLGRRNTGSPLQRYWTPFRCNPSSWTWEPRDVALDDFRPKKGPHGGKHYHIITTALVQAQRPIKSFEVPKYPSAGLPTIIFERPWNRCPMPDVAAFAGLERLIFRLASYGESEDSITPELYNNVTGLSELLRSMDKLKHLGLNLPSHLDEPPIFYDYDQVFPEDKQWPTLESLVLVAFSIKATDLMHLLENRMPNLKHLVIGEIRLLEGTWEGVFECLKRSGRLSSFRFVFDTYLFHCDGEDFWDPKYKDGVYEDLECYVLEGGRHPCLVDEEPDSNAQKFVDNMRRFTDTNIA